MLPTLYRVATTALTPLLLAHLNWRRRRGKEDPRRFRERLGFPGRPRPPGPLVWMHAASVGEATSILALVERLLDQRPGIGVLVTTGTVASARLLEGRLPPDAHHQFVPIDLRHCVGRFLDHWHPDLAVWVESELWPNLVRETHARGIAMVLLNGRLSARSERRWRRLPGLIRPMLGAFTLVLAQDDEQATRFRRLGAATATSVGDLKAAAAMLPFDAAALGALHRAIGTRPLWLAASTHPGEETIAAEVHRRIVVRYPDLLTIIAPRHPGRGGAIAGELAALGLCVARRSRGEPITAATQIYLADTMGELGLFYRLAGIAFIGGSFAGKGGHNPFEAAQLDCAVLHGPDISNCAAMMTALQIADAAETVADAAGLAAAVTRLLANPADRARRAVAAAAVAARGGQTLDRVVERLSPWLDRLAPIASEDRSPTSRTMLAARADARA